MKRTRRFIALFVAAFLLLSAFPHLAFAEPAVVLSGTCGNGMTYTLYANGKMVIGGDGYMRNYWVVELAEEEAIIIAHTTAPWDGMYITEVEIGPDVKSVGAYAFALCGDLKKISLPDGLKEIGDCAFAYCGALAEVSIPDSVTLVGLGAFGNCEQLASVKLPANFSERAKIEYAAFSNCPKLADIDVSERDVLDIAHESFDGTAWYDAQPDGILYMGSVAIGYKGEMPENTSLTLKDNCYAVGDYAFSGYENLVSITLPRNVSRIGDGAFRGSGLQSCRFLGAVIEIGEDVWWGYRPSSLGLTALEGFSSDMNVLEFPSETAALGRGVGEPRWTEISFPANLAAIHPFALKGSSGLKSVEIPKTVNRVGKGAFSGCSSLESLTVAAGNPYLRAVGNCLLDGKRLVAGCRTSVIPDDNSVWIVGDYAFAGNEGLTSVSVPGTVKRIGESAFEDCCNLSKLTVTEGVTQIDKNAFNSCSALKSVTLPASLTELRDEAFESSGLTSISVPEKINCLNYGLYMGCSGLTSVVIPDQVTEIADMAFCACENLRSVRLGAGVRQVTGMAFWANSRLNSVSVDNSNPVLHSYGNCAIDTQKKAVVLGCKNSRIPEDGSVTGIGKLAFCGVDGLEEFTVPKAVTDIGLGAFYACWNLKSVTLWNTVSDIAEAAFLYCDDLEDVYFYGTQEEWDALAARVGAGNDSLLNANIHFMCDHQWDEGEVLNEATCTSNGEIEYTCLVCGEKKTEEIPEFGHDEVAEVIVPPTADTEGIVLYTCRRCGEEYDSAVPKLKTPGDDVLLGDVDGNGKIESADYRLADRASVGLEYYPVNTRAFFAADVSQDGIVTSFDARKIIRVATGKEAAETAFVRSGGFIPDSSLSQRLVLKLKEIDGETVKVAVVAQNCVGLESLDFDVFFDPELLSYNYIVPGADCDAVSAVGGICGWEVNEVYNRLRLSYLFRESLLSAEEYAALTDRQGNPGSVNSDEFELFVLSFDRKEAAGLPELRVRVKESGGIGMSVEEYSLKLMRGDIDQDGSITAADARLALRAAVGFETYAVGTPQYLAVDVFGSGRFTARGARAILRAATGMATPEEAFADVNGYACDKTGLPQGLTLVADKPENGEIKVRVVAKDCVGLESADFEIAYDPAVLSFEYDLAGADAEEASRVKNNGIVSEVNGSEPGRLRCAFLFRDYMYSAADFAAAPVVDSGDPATVNTDAFEVMVLVFSYQGNNDFTSDLTLQMKESGGIELNAKESARVFNHTQHNWVLTETTRPASCSEEGEGIYRCTVCGEEKKDTIAKTEHTWNEGEITTPATAETEGEMTYTCTVCGQQKKEPIPKTESYTIDTEKAKEQGDKLYAAQQTAEELLAAAGEGAELIGADGVKPLKDDLVGTGMILKKRDGTGLTIVVKGDVVGDGKTTAADARLALRRAVDLESYDEASAQFAACEVTGDGLATAADARMILRAAVGLEKLPLE